MRVTRTTLAVVAVAATALAGCGGDDEQATAGATAEHGAAHAQTAAAHGGGHDGGHMTELASAERGDMTIAVAASPPETFYVSEGDDLREQAPAPGDDAHLMVTLTDTESGIRLPDATVTARVSDTGGEVVFEGPLYPMVGRGMGMHYGENVDVGEAGRYEITLTVGSPRVGRHEAVAKAWRGPQRVALEVEFDGESFHPAS